MHRTYSFAAFILLVPALAIAADQLYSLGFPAGAKFNVIDGKPYVLRKGESGPPGNAVDINGKEFVHFGSGKALAYPLDGEGTTVVLGGEGTGTQWDFSLPERGGSTIRAAEGKFKGWYLDWAEEEEEITSNNSTYHVRRLMLVKEPKNPKKFVKYPVAK
jgi:hypothetical protein